MSAGHRWGGERDTAESWVVSSPRRLLSFSRSKGRAHFSVSDSEEKKAGGFEHGTKPSEVYGFVGSISTVVATGEFQFPPPSVCWFLSSLVVFYCLPRYHCPFLLFEESTLSHSLAKTWLDWNMFAHTYSFFLGWESASESHLISLRSMRKFSLFWWVMLWWLVDSMIDLFYDLLAKSDIWVSNLKDDNINWLN